MIETSACADEKKFDYLTLCYSVRILFYFLTNILNVLHFFTNILNAFLFSYYFIWVFSAKIYLNENLPKYDNIAWINTNRIAATFS